MMGRVGWGWEGESGRRDGKRRGGENLREKRGGRRRWAGEGGEKGRKEKVKVTT
jgi:hypothetical protein